MTHCQAVSPLRGTHLSSDQASKEARPLEELSKILGKIENRDIVPKTLRWQNANSKRRLSLEMLIKLTVGTDLIRRRVQCKALSTPSINDKGKNHR